MTFREALNKSIEEFGVEILNEPRLINIINDFHGFDEKPATRHITRVIISGGYMSQLLSKKDSTFATQQMISTLCEQYGFSEKIVAKIVNIIIATVALIDIEKPEPSKVITQKSSEKKIPEVEIVAKGTNSVQRNESSNISNDSITKFKEEELSNVWVDRFGVKYSQDRTKLLEANEKLIHYDIPEGVKVINDRAFCQCKKLKTINMPKGILKIGNRAFFGCALEKIEMQEGLTFIDDYAFGFCINLRSVKLPRTMNGFGKNPFISCDLTEFSCDSDAFIVEKNCLFDKEKTKIISFWGDAPIVKLPNTIKTICDSAFIYSKIMAIILPNNLTHIENDAFSGCRFLSSIKLPQNLMFIGDYAFYDCKALKLEPILPLNLAHIGDYAFAKCFALKKIILPKGLQHIGSGAICQNNVWQIKCWSSEFIVYNNGLYSKDKKRLIKYFGKDTRVDLPSEVVLIDSSAFERCKFLESIKLHLNLQSISDSAFSNCESLKSIELPSSVNNIGMAAFAYCYSLLNINIPQGIKKIDSSTFRCCASLTDIELPSSVTIIDDSAFENSGLTSIKFPESIKQIGNDAFRGCSSLKIIEMPEVVPSIGKRAFDWCKSIRAILIHQGTRIQYSNILPNFLRQKLTNLKKN